MCCDVNNNTKALQTFLNLKSQIAFRKKETETSLWLSNLHWKSRDLSKGFSSELTEYFHMISCSNMAADLLPLLTTSSPYAKATRLALYKVEGARTKFITNKKNLIVKKTIKYHF